MAAQDHPDRRAAWPIDSLPRQATEGPSPSWIEGLRDHLSQHVSSERELLDEYERLAENSSDEGVSYLIRLIIDDERRHHGLFQQILNTIDWHIDLQQGGTRVPALPIEWKTPRLRELTAALLEAEREDARELRELRKTLKPLQSTTLWSLLVELMELDTKKHQLILSFIHNQASD